MLKLHQAGLKRYWKLKRIVENTLGQYTSIELAIRGTAEAPEAGLHSHSVVFVPARYFEQGPAIWQPDYCAMWEAAARLDYQPIVDVRLLKAADGSDDRDAVYASAVECAKYIVSSESLFAHESGQIHVDGRVVLTILAAFRRARLHRYDRCFAEAAKALRMSNPV